MENSIELFSNNVYKKNLLSRYKIEFDKVNDIDIGGFGNIVKCFNKLDKKCYALKMIPMIKYSEGNQDYRYSNEDQDYRYSDIERILYESEILSSLQHENIVRYHTTWFELCHAQEFPRELIDSFQDEYKTLVNNVNNVYPTLIIQMELCEQSLKTYLENNELNNLEKIRFIKEILKGVGYLHSNKIIHRDLNTSNILIKNGTIKIGDFGISIKEGHQINISKYYGNINYLAPECLEDINNSTYKSDIYSLGIIFFEILNNFKTLTERNIKLIELKSKKFHSNIFDKVIYKMLNDNPEKRPSVKELLEIIQNK